MDIINVLKILNINLIEWSAVIILLLSIIQIVPIKINPWSWIARHVGRALNHDVIKDIEKVNDRIDQVNTQLQETGKDIEKLQDQIIEKDMLDTRRRILHFNRELIKEESHTEEEYNEILDDITNYDKFCDSHPLFPNKKTVFAEENIHKCYNKRLEKHDFL